MKITRHERDGSEVLGPYYEGIANPFSPCNPSDETKWTIGPYNIEELLKWIFKMLVLPGVIAALIIGLLILNLFNNLISQIVSSVFSTIATFFIYIYSREKFLEAYHKIRGNEVLDPGLTKLNKLKDDPEFSIGFVGDIMMLRGHELKFDHPIKNFFKDVPLIVGNLEGIIPEQNNSFAEQSHPEKILDQLVNLLKNGTEWLLCVSNNHSIDFGNNKFFKSTIIIQNQNKCNTFGRWDVPKVFVDDKFCISSATKWSNQKTWDCTSKFEDRKLEKYYCIGDNVKYNILYPHWGYENERYTRRKIQKKAIELLTCKSQQIAEDKKKKWDLIFSHHPHTRQPVMVVKEVLKNLDGDNNKIVLKKLVAFSGGNFTSGVKFIRKKKHIHGIIMKCKIGPLLKSPDHYAVGEVEWLNTFNEKDGNTKTVKIGEGIADRTRIYIMLIGIAAFLIAFIPRILALCP